MPKTYNIIFTGVGGQGLMLLSAILGKAAVDAGLDVMTGEQHGLSQRSGSISVHFRMGKPISPLIPYGKADLMIAMEPTEALRYIEYLKEEGVIISSRRIMPAPSETEAVALDKKKNTRYFTVDEIEKRLRNVTSKLIMLDSLEMATRAGNPRTENSVLVGAVAACPDFPIPAEQVKNALLQLVPPSTREANASAFEMGRQSGGRCLER